MSFDLADFNHIVSTIDDFLSMSEPQSLINISNGYKESEDSEEKGEGDRSFMSLTFSLKNGVSEIRVYDSIASFEYKNSSGDVIKYVEFDDNVLETNSSFRRAIKQIRDADRQQATIVQNILAPINRASFGLAEVNQ